MITKVVFLSQYSYLHLLDTSHVVYVVKYRDWKPSKFIFSTIEKDILKYKEFYEQMNANFHSKLITNFNTLIFPTDVQKIVCDYCDFSILQIIKYVVIDNGNNIYKEMKRLCEDKLNTSKKLKI